MSEITMAVSLPWGGTLDRFSPGEERRMEQREERSDKLRTEPRSEDAYVHVQMTFPLLTHRLLLAPGSVRRYRFIVAGG